MRCRICNKDIVADEVHDKRDNTFYCASCDDDVKAIIYEWEEELEEDSDNTPDMP